jgi:hypothetical protein
VMLSALRMSANGKPAPAKKGDSTWANESHGGGGIQDDLETFLLQSRPTGRPEGLAKVIVGEKGLPVRSKSSAAGRGCDALVSPLSAGGTDAAPAPAPTWGPEDELERKIGQAVGKLRTAQQC